MQELKPKSEKAIFKDAIEFNLDYLFTKCGDHLTNEELNNFLCAVSRTVLNFYMANKKIMPDEHIAVNMEVRGLTDSIQTDLESYVDYLDDFFRKAVE